MRELFPPQRPKGFLSGGEDLLGNVSAGKRFSTLRPHLFRTADLCTECSNLCCGEAFEEWSEEDFGGSSDF